MSAQVHVDKGMRDGQKIMFRGEGNQKPGIEPGDVIVVLQQLPHEAFQREGHVSTVPTPVHSGHRATQRLWPRCPL